MPSKSMDFVVGLVFVTAMGILGYATIFKGELLSGEKVFYAIDFPKVYGLKEGSEVRCEGKKVGKVKSLKLIDDYVRAVIEVKENVKIYAQTAKVKVTPFSPLGGRIVEISRGKPTDKDNPQLIKSVSYLGNGEIEALDGTKQPEVIKGEAEGELLSALTELIKDNRDNINSIVANIEDATDRLDEKDNLIGKVLTDKDFAQKIDDMSGHLRDASKSVAKVTRRLENGEGILGELTVADSPLEQGVDRLVDKAGDTFDEASKVTKTLNEGKGAIPTLINDQETGENTRAIAKNLNGFTEKLNNDDGIMKIFTEPQVYDNLESVSADARSIFSKVNDPEAGIAGYLVADKSGRDNLDRTTENLGEVSEKLNSKESGPLGVLITDEELGQTTRQVFSEAGRVIKEFRDSTEDIREQAPVSAFLGTVFAAF